MRTNILKKPIVAMTVAVVLCNVFFTGCIPTMQMQHVHTHATRLSGKIHNVMPVPIKDFVSLGIIFAEAEETVDGSNISGSQITYRMLLEMAKELGADDIVNFRVDVITHTTNDAFNNRILRKYMASALAIKYTNAVPMESHSDFGSEETSQRQTVAPWWRGRD